MSRLVFNRNNGSADEYGHLLALNRLLSSGDVIEGMAVVASTSPDMNVHVSGGSARITTGTYPSSYGYFVGIDTTSGSPAGEVVAITTAPSSNSRIDTIVAYVDLSVTASSATPNNPNNMLKLAAVAGTVSASPTAPSNSAIQSAIGASNPFIKLANVAVGTSVTSINNGNITDLRSFATVSYAADLAPTTTRWRELGRTTLPSANATISVTGLTACNFLRVTVVASGTGTTTEYMQFNGDTGNNYAWRYSVDGSSDSPNAAVVNWAWGGDNTRPASST